MRRKKNGKAVLLMRFVPLFFPLIFIFIFFLIPTTDHPNGFMNLPEIELFASSLKEGQDMENTDLYKPKFDSFFSGYKTSFLTRKWHTLLTRLHLKKIPTWSPSFFKNLIERVTKKRKDLGYSSFVVHKHVPTEQSRWIVVGDVQGAFHSLVRLCKKWKEMGFIDDSLTIKRADTYILFMGDAIDRSPYSMETLSLILRLWEQNPQSVIYFAGNHEQKSYWKDFTLKDELMAKAAHLSPEQIPLESQVNALFETLSLGFFIKVPAKEKSFVRISPEGRADKILLQENLLSSFLCAKEAAPLSFSLLSSLSSAGGSEIDIPVIIKSEKKAKTYQTMPGMRQTTSDLGSFAWTFLSCPTPLYQKGLQFFYDAFGLVTPVFSDFSKWTIELYNQDVRILQGFKSTGFFLLSGKPTNEQETASSQVKGEQSSPEKDKDKTAPTQVALKEAEAKETNNTPPQKEPAKVDLASSGTQDNLKKADTQNPTKKDNTVIITKKLSAPSSSSTKKAAKEDGQSAEKQVDGKKQKEESAEANSPKALKQYSKEEAYPAIEQTALFPATVQVVDD